MVESAPELSNRLRKIMREKCVGSDRGKESKVVLWGTSGE